MTKGNHRPTRTRRGLQKEDQGPQSPSIRQNLQRSILLLRRLGGYCRVSILGIPKARKLVSTLTSLDGSRHIKRSCPTPRLRAPSRPTSRPRAPSRPTPWARAPSRPTPWTRFTSRPMGTHTAANHSRSKRMGLGQNSDAREEAGMPRCNLWP